MDKAGQNRYSELEQLTGYRFKNLEFLEAAMTHPSCSSVCNYETTEFLGDRVIGLLVADLLFARFTSPKELGQMAICYNKLVCTDTLATVARNMRLGEYVRVGKGEINLSNHVLADLCEAFIGALYLDGGLEVARRVIGRFWPVEAMAFDSAEKDAKSKLQEWTQKVSTKLPRYNVEEIRGEPNQLFRAELQVEDYQPVYGEGRNKQLAQQEAADNFIKRHLAGID